MEITNKKPLPVEKQQSSASKNNYKAIAEDEDEEKRTEKNQREKITKLINAVKYGELEEVEAALINSEIINRADDSGRIALIVAVQRLRDDLVWFLITRGHADVTNSDGQGRTALIWASKLGTLKIARILIEKRVNVTQRANGIRRISRRSDANWRDDSGKTALMYAAEKGHAEIVRLLLKHGADFNMTDNAGRTPLIFAASNFHRDVVSILTTEAKPFLAKCVDYTETDDVMTALGWACRNGDSETASLLLDKGARVDARVHFGRTPLCYAAANGHADMVRMLIGRGASVTHHDYNAETPGHLANSRRHFDIANMLPTE